MTSGRAAIASALSICSSGVTQTGQPGPWIIRTPFGSASSIPCLTSVWVCPPQTSISAQGLVVMRWISSTSLRASSALRYSSTYFMRRPGAAGGAAEVGDPARPTARPPVDFRHRPELHRHALGVDGAQHLERLERLVLVELADREADVDDHVVAQYRPRARRPGRLPCARRRSRREPCATVRHRGSRPPCPGCRGTFASLLAAGDFGKPIADSLALRG